MDIFEDRFNQFFNSLNDKEIHKFIENPVTYLTRLQLPIVERFQPYDIIPEEKLALNLDNITFNNVVSNNSSPISVSKSWWGISIKLNNDITKKIIDGTATVSTLIGFLSAIPILNVAAPIIAAVIFLKSLQIRLVNKGKGVYFPITWLQLAAIPAGGIAAAMLVIHPFSN